MSTRADHNLFDATDLYLANYQATEDVVVNQGGTSSGKTYAIDQCLFTHCYEEPRIVCTVSGQDLPNLKVGAIRDAEEIVDNSPVLRALIKSYNRSDFIYTFHNGSVLEFKSYGNAQDAKSGKRDYLFMNEANGQKPEVYNELALRTRKKIYIDYNPNSEFWVHKNLIGKPGVKLLISDHRHNPFVPEKVREKIENIEDPELFKVYARGLTGKIEGLIYRNYNIVPFIPPEASFVAAWLDFGFTNDVTSFGEMYKLNGELWVDELIYETGLTNVPVKGLDKQHPNIHDRLADMGYSKGRRIRADSAEQKSIVEINQMGWNIHPVKKYPGSVKDGIDILQRYKINITERSVNTRKEFGTYKWKVNKDGVTVNEPIDFNNHSLDGIRYIALEDLANGNSSGMPNYI